MKPETLTFSSGKTFLLTDHSDYTLENERIIELYQGASISTLYEDTLHAMNIAGTLHSAGKIETKQLSVLTSGRLIIEKPTEVTGSIIIAPGGFVMIGFKPKPFPNPPGHEYIRKKMIEYYQSKDTLALYSKYSGMQPEEISRYFAAFMKSKPTVYEVNSAGMLSTTNRFGSTGADLVGLGWKLPPPPGPRGSDPAITAEKIVFGNDSNLTFSFERGYTPTIGDTVLLANIPMQIGENVHCNLAPGWVMVDSVATVQYVGAQVR